MDRETLAAIVDTVLVCRQHANPLDPPNGGGDLFAVKQLGRRARSLEAALWRGEVPSWWRPGGELPASQRATVLEVRQMAERLRDVAARAVRNRPHF